MKKIVYILLVCFLFLLIIYKQKNKMILNSTPSTNHTQQTGCDIFSECKTKEEKTNLYISLIKSESSPFQEITMEEAVAIFENKKDDYLFFSFQTCPWCLDALPILNDVAKQLNKTIKYINVRPDGTKESDLRTENNPAYVSLQAYCGDVANDGSNKIYVPFFVVVKNGKLHAYQLELDYDAKNEAITDAQKDEYRKIYTKLLSESFSF